MPWLDNSNLHMDVILFWSAASSGFFSALFLFKQRAGGASFLLPTPKPNQLSSYPDRTLSYMSLNPWACIPNVCNSTTVNFGLKSSLCIEFVHQIVQHTSHLLLIWFSLCQRSFGRCSTCMYLLQICIQSRCSDVRSRSAYDTVTLGETCSFVRQGSICLVSREAPTLDWPSLGRTWSILHNQGQATALWTQAPWTDRMACQGRK